MAVSSRLNSREFLICRSLEKGVYMGKYVLLTIKVITQIGGLILFFEFGDFLQHQFRLPLPGNLIGMMVLFLCFLTGIIKISWLESGANFLLAVTPLFFVPALTGLMNYGELFLHQGYLILGVTIISGLLIFFLTGYFIQLLTERKMARK
ncbi:CidA/LrgA family protein [Listeria ilorinensis]|uniref:CidA/LrgA family protein n=1 Tax=Listeria ilorinensis TaxID=2867439 RepID=UPI001EF40B66|nr:CidA/LrgA family protein [Listeria ilorinensis]